MAAGEGISRAGENLSKAMEEISNVKDKNFISIINKFSFFSNQALTNIKKASDELNITPLSSIPAKNRKEFLNLRKQLNSFSKSFQEVSVLIQKLKIFLGETEDKRYLLVFQNNSELRATGGFIGSFALVDFSNGRLEKIEVPPGGSYDTEGGLTTLVRAPQSSFFG